MIENKPHHKAREWLAFALVPLTLAALVLEEGFPVAVPMHWLLQIGIVLFTFRLAFLTFS